MHATTLPSFADVEAAAKALGGVVAQTPCVQSEALSALAGARVTLKCENLQRTGSFKVRGAYVKLRSLEPAERLRGVVAASAGNHAQGVAYHAARLGIDATIVMPTTTPYAKVRRTEAHGVRVVLDGETFADAARAAEAIALECGRTMLHPYDDPWVIAGQGTVGIEMLRERPDLDAVLVPVGGGGLIAGVAIAVKHLAPNAEVIGIRSEMPANGAPTLAEGIAVKHLGRTNAAIVADFVDDMLAVGEPEIVRAIHHLLDDEKMLVEGAGAAPLAALFAHRERFAGRRVGLILSGANLDTGLLASVILRARFQQGVIARVRVQIGDAPGSLVGISTLLAAHHANVVDVSHHRAFSGVPAKCAELDFTIEMRHPRDIDAILAELRDAAFETTVLAGGGAHVA
jgi:threonine dehydratase